MNEKAIKVAYELFVADGYTRSIDDFKKLMRDNPKGREVAYKLFVTDGYNKSINDFSILMGATESLGETPQPEVKKKGMALPSEDGSLASSETDVISKEDLLQQTVTPSDRMQPKPTQTQVDYELGFNVAPDERIFEEQEVSEAPTQRGEFAGTIISEQPPKAFSEPVVQDGVSVSEQVKYDPFIESVNKVVNKELVSNDLRSVLLPLLSIFTRPDATEENVIPQMRYYFGEYGFEFEPADVFGDGMTVKAKNGKQTYVNLDQAFGGEKTAEDLKKFLIENREVKEYAASDRKIYDEQQIKDAVGVLNEQAKEWNNATVELGKLKAMNEQMSQELLGISQYDIDTNPEIKQKVDMYNINIAAEKQLLDLVMKKGEEFEGKGILLDRLAGEYYAMKGEQGGMMKGITAGILGRGPANINSGGVDYGVDIYTYLSKNASLTEDKYKEELIRIAKEEGYLPKDEDFSGLSKQQLIERLGGDTNDATSFLKGLALAGKQMLGFDPIGREKEEEALGIPTNFDKVNAKVLDYARKGIKYYNDYGVEGLDYDKAVEGRTVNPFSEIAAKVDTEMGLIDASRQYGEIISENIGATKEWSDLTKEGFWGGAILGLAESIPAMVGGMDKVGTAQRIAQMFLMTSSHVENEMSKNPMFDNISESEKLPVKIAIGTVGAVLENYGFRNIISKNSFVANLALRALKKVPKGSSVKTLSEVISQDIESSIARGGLTLFAAGASEFETGAAQELSSIIIKDIYNETKDKEMFQTPESLRDVAVQTFYAGAQEMVGGKIMGTPGAVVAAVSGKSVQSLSDMDWRNFEMINEDPTMKEIYVSKLKAEIANPKSDKSLADAKAELESVNRIQGLLNSNKQYIGNLSPEQKKRSVQLLLQKQELENKLKNADSQLSSSDRNLLDRVNDELDDLSKASTRIEESMEAEEKTIQEYKGNLMDWIKSIGKSKDIGDVMEGGVEIEMDGTKVIMTESDGGVVLESIETQKGKKGKGKAEAAIKQITEKADNDGVSITLKVVPKDSTVDAKRLQNLYERNGFEMQEDGVTMVRTPKVQELTQEQKDIEAFFTEDTDEDIERASDNLSINRANQDQGTKSPNRANAISAAKFAAKAISKIAPNVRIVLHEAESEYSKYTNNNNSGEYNPETNVIHINLPKVRRSTVAHEVFHAILVEKVKGDDTLAKKISDDMVRVVQRRLPKNHKLRIAVEAHAAKYQGDQAQLQTEEQIAELIGLLSSVEGGYTQLDSDMKSVIKRFFLNLAKKLNIPLPKNWGSDQDVVDLINTLARKTRTGEEITEEDVKLLDVKDEGIDGEQQGTEGEVGTITISRQQKDSIDAPSVNNDPRPWVRELVEDVDISTLNGRNFITNMYDYTNAGVTELGNGYNIELLGGRNYVPIIMNKTGKKLGDVSNLAAFNTKSQAEGFIRNAKKGKADLFAPHSGTLKDSWQFQQHIFEQLVDLVLDKNILTNEELIEIFNVNLRNESAKKLYAKRIKSIKEKGYYTKKVDKKEVKVTKKPNKPSNFLSPFKKFRKASGLEINNLNSFKSDPKELVRLLNIENNFSPDLRKNLNQKIVANKKFQKAIGVKNLTEFYNKIMDPLNKGVVGGEIMTFIEFDPTTFEVAKTDPADVDHHPSFGWVVKAKIKKIMQPNKFFKSYDITDTYTKYNKNETVVSRKTDEKFAESNVKSSAGSQPKIAKVTTPATRQQKGIQEARENGEVIETDSELVFFKGMQPKMKNGKPFSVHTIDKGRFVALDKNIALDYKGNKPLKQFKVPKGTTVQVVNVPSDSITKYRKAEEKAINESDAQIVKLITIDARGRSEQYVIKDPALLKTATDVKEVSVKAQEKQTSRARQQKGLINFTEKDAIKYSKIGINDARTIQAMENIGLSGVKFTDEGVNKKIKESLNELYSKADSYLLDEDSDEITRLMNFEIEAAINDGQPERVINQLKSQVDNRGARDRFILQLKNTQEETLDQWVSYLEQSDYSDAFKYLMLDAVLTHNYDLKSLKYRKRTNKTSRNISPFDAGTLAMVYASDSKNLLKSYVEMQQENLDNIINASQVDKTTEGKWLKFDGGPNAENINETATALSQLVQDTYWCTKTNALSQLKGGDFYVYVTGRSPRIAIRMDGDKVGEVRGNASSKQDLEPDMLPVAETFLKENIPNNSGKKWLDSIEFNKKAKEFIERAKKGIGEKEILEYANIVSEGKKYNTDYGENGFVEKAKSIFRDKNYYNEDILDRVAFNADEFDTDKTEYLIGNIRFGYRDITTLGNLKVITGDADFDNSQVTDLGKLQSIGGYAIFRDSQVTDLGKLQNIGGTANFSNSQVESLGQLQSIGGDAYFDNSQVTDLGQLKSIGGDADFDNSQVTNLGKLQSIGGDATFDDSQVTNLGQLQNIGGTADFRDSQVTDLGQLQSIGRNAFLRNSQVESLGKLQSIGGYAIFRDSQVTDLGKLQSIGGNAYFSDSQVTDLGQLQSIGRDADFSDSQVESLGKLQSIGGNAYFDNSQVESLGKLQSIGGNAYFDNSQVTDLGKLQSIGGTAYFINSQVESLGQLQSIGGDAFFGASQVDLKAEWNSRQNKPAIRQSKSTQEYISEARQEHFKDSLIRDFLIRVKGKSAKEVDELMSLSVSLLDKMPKSFGNVKGGAKVGLKLYEKLERFRIQEQKRNNKRKNKLTEQEIIDKTIEFLEKQPEYINEGDTYTVGSKEKGTQKTLFRAGISSQQAKMLSDIQKSIGIRPTQNMGVKIAKARLALRERRKGAIDLQKVKTEVRNFIRKTLPSELYEKKEVLDLINKVNEANEGNIENIISEIEAFVIETNNKSLQKKIDGVLNGKYQTVEGGRRKPKKITDEIRKRIEFIKSNLVSPESTPEEIGEANTKLLERFNEIQEQNFITPEQLEEQADIQVAMQYNNAMLMENSNSSKVTELDGIYSTLENLIKHGRSLLQEELRKSHEAYNKTFELGYEAITGEKVDMNDPDSKRQLNNQKKKRFSDEKRKKNTQGVIKRFASNIATILKAPFGSAEALNGLMNRLDKLPGELFGGRLNEMFTERVDESSRRFKMRMMQIESVIGNYLAETYGKKWEQISRQNRMQVDHNIELHDGIMLQPLSQDDIGYLYNMYKDPANRASFANPDMWGSEVIEKDDSKSEKERKQRINEANAARVMKELEAKLDPKVKEFADWQVDVLYPALYEEYNKTYKKLYRTDLPWNKFYAGTIYRDGFSETDTEVMNLLGRGNTYKTAVGANSTKVRQGSNLPIKPMNMTDVLNTYINDMEYFAAYGETIRDMDKFFSNKYVKSAIIDIHGQEVYTFVDDMIKKIASRGLQNSGFRAKTINALNDVFILSRLALSPVIAIKQLTSTFTYANDIGYVNWIKSAAKNKTQQLKVWKEISENSVYIQDRYKNSITKAIETYSDTKMKAFLPETSYQQGWNWFVDFAMYTTKLGDKGAIYLGGSPNYTYYKDQALKQGKTEKEAIDIAIRKFERDTKRTQQSSDLQDKDYLQTGDPITKALNMFLTTPKQYLRNEIIAVRNLYRAISGKAYKGTVGQNVRTFVTYHFFMPLLFQYVSMGLPGILRGFRDDDDEDLLRAAIIGNLNGLFILGEVVNTIGDLFTGKPWIGTQTKSLGILQIVNSLARKFNKAVNYKDKSKRDKAFLDAYLELATLTGMPAPTIKKFFDNYSKLNSTDDPGEIILRLLNYSDYQISGPNTNKSKVKSVSEMNEEYQKEKEKKEKDDQKDRIGFYD